jgi:hypothetical protein
MTLNEILSVSGGVLVSLGGGAAIVIACSSWLGKIWASRILESEKAQLQKEMEFYKKDLQKEIEAEKFKLQQEVEKAKSQYQLETEKNKAKFLRYSETQFKLYNDLWTALCDLETTAETLWESAEVDLVLHLRTKLVEAKKALRKGYLLVEDGDYKQLIDVLQQFEQFQFGKSQLLKLRSRAQLAEAYVDEAAVRNVIDVNGNVRTAYSNLLEVIRRSFKQQISA